MYGVFGMIRFLDMINKSLYEYQFRRSVPFTDEQFSIVHNYFLRLELIKKLEHNLNIIFKRY